MQRLFPWFPEAPVDYRARCASIAKDPDARGRELRRLAAYDLDDSKLRVLSKTRRILRDQGRLDGCQPFRLAVLSNATTDYLVAAVEATGLRYGLDLEVRAAEYGQILQEALDPCGQMNRWNPDAVLLAVDHRGLPLTVDPGHSDARAAEEAVAYLRQVADGVRANCGAMIIFQTIPPPAETLFGSLDGHLEGTQRWLIQQVNRLLREVSRGGSGYLLFDVEGLANSIGLQAWHDPGQWHLAKLPFAQHLTPLYADHLTRVLAAMRGLSKKCLVLDLDNTLWGGVVGDDGLGGIVLGNGSAAGEAFLDVQRTALSLRDRGVVLAVCSKNDECVARLPFRDHPEMLLKEHHIAAFQANWRDKASNLEAIAEQLNIGIDSLVLLDDNPAERAQVRDALPMVGVPELPDDPAQFTRTLLQAGYFEAVTFAAEDRQRAEDYQANTLRAKLRSDARNLDDYLRSLEMVAYCGSFSPVARQRVTQLINKTNQFNLTTRRYSEAEIAALEADPSATTLYVRLVDRFSDNGIIGIVICRRTGLRWDVDTWLMSCRVLGRQVEQMVLNQLVERARAEGVSEIIGRFVPSGRNDMVHDLFGRLGFSFLEADGNDELWRLDVGSYEPKGVPMIVHAVDPNPAVDNA